MDLSPTIRHTYDIGRSVPQIIRKLTFEGGFYQNFALKVAETIKNQLCWPKLLFNFITKVLYSPGSGSKSVPSTKTETECSGHESANRQTYDNYMQQQSVYLPETT